MTAGRSRLAGAALGAACLVLGGCYEETGATLYEPGEYKGAADPLHDTQLTEPQQARLEERFLQVQTDR